MTIHDFFRAAVDVEGLAGWLDRLDPVARTQAARDLSAAEQATLFEAVKAFRPLALDDFVPPATPPLREVIHFGRNSLPVFRIFEKRFCRPDQATDALWGYNEQRFRTLTGPGYFVARPAPPGEVVIDYTELPPGRAPGWPEILPNSARLSRFVYDGTRDLMRGLSRHVTIGRATRAGKPMDNWFVLCRDDADLAPAA